MVTNKSTMLSSIVIVVLAGISIAQYRQLNEVSTIVANLKAKNAALGVPDVTVKEPMSQRPYQNEGDGSKMVTMSDKSLAKPELPPTPLSHTQYWISTDYSDSKPHGYAAWLELVPGGHFILEHCFAPDYSVAVSVEQSPYQLPKCKTIADSRISSISDTKIELKDDMSVSMSLDVSAETHTLSLELEDHKIEIAPGQKNTLLEGLSSLPSIKKAYEVVWEKHIGLREELEASEE